jgi:hypothetical protein
MGIGRMTSSKHAALAISEDQNATHRRTGMTIFSSADRSLLNFLYVTF